MNSKGKALLAVSAVVFSFVILFVFYGYNQTWRLWNVPVMFPPGETVGFSDLRVITHGADSVAKGLDPLISNPDDPWGRPVNYPRVWQILYSLGINKSQTVFLGLIMIFCFLTGVVVVLHNSTNMTIALGMGALISPAVLIGVERANIDLFIFFLVVTTIYFARKSAILGDLLIIFSTALKLYPIFGLTFMLRMRERKFLLHAGIVVAILSVYFALIWPELILISRATPRATDLSYGMNVFWMRMQQFNYSLGLLSHIICFALILVAACLAVVACRRPSILEMTDLGEGSFSFDSFRVGSSVYLGTFILGNNWDYRLSFLILVIPQLSLWMASSNKQLRLCSKGATCALFASMWYLAISELWARFASNLIHVLPKTKSLPWLFDELVNWLLFFLLTYLFFLTLPEWTKNLLRFPYRPTKRRT